MVSPARPLNGNGSRATHDEASKTSATGPRGVLRAGPVDAAFTTTWTSTTTLATAQHLQPGRRRDDFHL